MVHRFVTPIGLFCVALSMQGCRKDAKTDKPGDSLVELFGGDREDACKYVSSLRRPYVVGWDELKLNDLQRAVSRSRPLAVRLENCSLELLPGCTAASGDYRFQNAAMTDPQVVELRSAAEAMIQFQLGGVNLETHFDHFKKLQVTRALGGTWETTTVEFYADDFSGSRCEGATHTVQAIDVGAYMISGQHARGGGAGAQVGGAGARAGAGASASVESEKLTQRGDPRSCSRTWRDTPVDECQTPIRLTLQPIRPASERRSMCPYRMRYISRGGEGSPSLDFCLDITEVTVADYRKCVEVGACETPSRSRYGTWRDVEKQQHPVNDVDWFDATRYCEWAGKRLPTVEEWRWVASGREEQRGFPWGSLPPARDLACWDRLQGKLGTCVAAEHSRGASRDGILGLAGNVSEWTATVSEQSKRKRAVVGGNWRESTPHTMRALRRDERRAGDDGDGDLGFRCAAAVRQPG